MTGSRRFTLSGYTQSKGYNLTHFEYGRDGSLYIIPSMGNKLGMHLSLHSSGVTQIATRNPRASARFKRQDLNTDIMNKKQLFINNKMPFRPKDAPGAIAILKTQDLLHKPPSFTNQKIAIDLQRVMKSSVMVTSDSIAYACDYLLQQKHYIKDTDIVLIGDLNGDITFFTTPMSSELHKLRAMTINPSNLHSLTQLPGIKTIMTPAKELLKKISNTSLPVHNHIDNTEHYLPNLSPWMTLDIRSPK